MIKHIVFIKADSKYSDSEKENVLHKLKQKLDSLPSYIHEIKAYETGINKSNSSNAFDFALISEFESFETLEAYRVHPKHIEVLDFIQKIKEDVKLVDFEY